MGIKDCLFGVPFVVVALVFIVLRLCGVISWSWLWVLSPLWILGVMFLGIFAYLAVSVIGLLLRR